MSIAPAIAEHYPALTDAQRAIVGHLDGPLLVIAGPGSGKTYSFTGDLRICETCPRQYQFFREYDCTPSRLVGVA